MRRPKLDETRYGPFDVVVAGGGMAGIAATIAAARTGAKTLLLERAGWLGGMGITGATGLHSFFNIFGAHPGAERTRLVAGIAQDLVDRVQSLGGTMGHVRVERGADFVSMLTPVEPETFKYAAARICQEAGAKLLLHTTLDEVHATGGHVEGIVVTNKSGRSLIRAKQFVDCTGDGDVAAYAGAPFRRFSADDPGAYAAGFTFRLVNIDMDALEADLERKGILSHMAHAVKPGGTKPELVRLWIDLWKLPQSKEEWMPYLLIASSVRPREFTYCNCINYGPNDGLDEEALTVAETELRGEMLKVAEVFRKYIGGCEQCYPAGPAPYVGQRRGRAIHCEYNIKERDCVEGRQFDDQIGIFAFIDYPERWVRNAGAYGIPYRALIPRKLDNVLIAGRMMTEELVAHGSTRNTTCCLVCGQAAGTAAAMSALRGKGPRDLNPQELREQLLRDGVLLAPKPDPIA